MFYDVSANVHDCNTEFSFCSLANNWTWIYHGNETLYQLPTEIVERTNATFRLYTGNRYGRNEKAYAQIDIDLQRKCRVVEGKEAPSSRLDSQQWTFDNPVVIFTILISVLLLLLFGFVFIGCYGTSLNVELLLIRLSCTFLQCETKISTANSSKNTVKTATSRTRNSNIYDR